VHHGHADALASSREVAVEERVCHVAGDRVDPNTSSREICSPELPIAEVSGDNDESFASRQSLFDDAPPLNVLEAIDDLLRLVRRQDGGFDARATQVGVGTASNALDLLRRKLGK